MNDAERPEPAERPELAERPGRPVPDLPEVVTTTRLRMPLISPEDAEGMLAGRRRVSWHPDYPRPDDQDAVAMVRAGRPGHTWGPRHLTRAFDGQVVGSIGFFGGPVPGDDGVLEAEVGFGLVADARGHGAASEALAALVAYAEQVGVRVWAQVAPENRACLRVLARCGFTGLRGTGEDGGLVMVRPLAQKVVPDVAPGGASDGAPVGG